MSLNKDMQDTQDESLFDFSWFRILLILLILVQWSSLKVAGICLQIRSISVL
jgi:hypothetical protein